MAEDSIMENEVVKEHGEALKLDSNSPPDHQPNIPITPDADSLAEHSNVETSAAQCDEGYNVHEVSVKPGFSNYDASASSVSQQNETTDGPQSNVSTLYKRTQLKPRKKISAPTPIGKRGRVVSLDRRGYMYHDDEDEDEDDLSSQNSSDDGSYFSEQHLSPSSCARKNEFVIAMLPPRRSNSIGVSNSRVAQPYVFQRSQSLGQNSYSSVGSKPQDSDLSLSSSSNDDYSSMMNDENHLQQPYSMMRTSSAPETFTRRRPSLSIKPRSDVDSDVDLGPVANDVSSLHKPPMPARDGRQMAYSSDDVVLKPKGIKRFPSGSSLVSSSSEDVGDADLQEGHISSSVNHPDRDDDNASGTQRSRHRRQHSYRSLDSHQSLPIDGQMSNVWKTSFAVDVESELSDAESFMDNRRRRKPSHKRSDQSLTSTDSRIPLEIPNLKIADGRTKLSDLQNGTKVQSGVKQLSLNGEQMKAWQNGMVRSESYMSSSLSPERMHSVHSTDSNHSGVPNKTASATSFVYSEDDTDDSARQRELLLLASAQGERETNELVSTNFGVIDNRRKNIVGRERMGTNMELNAKDQSTEVGSSGRSTDRSRRSKRPISDSQREDGFEFVPSQRYTVYRQRWIMLLYMSLLNLLSDWTCYSIAPIAVLSTEAFGNINPEHLVTVFLAANAFSTALEPILLSRLGLRRTVVFGSFLLMCGNVIKSGGIPGLIGTELSRDDAMWRIYAGFLLVGLSQPLYQCTPTLLSCVWFPEKERTLATGIALNSNQIGVGFAFVFGTILVLSTEDIPGYFGLLSSISTLTFIGCFMQFKDAPPTPPSETARVIRGTLEVKIPYMDTMRQALPASFRNMHLSNYEKTHRPTLSAESGESRNTGSSANTSGTDYRLMANNRPKIRSYERNDDSPNSAFKNTVKSSRVTKRNSVSRDGKYRRSNRSRSASSDHGLRLSGSMKGNLPVDINKHPSPSSGVGPSAFHKYHADAIAADIENYGTIAPSTIAPSPMINGRVSHMRRIEGERHFVTPPHGYNEELFRYSDAPMPGYTPQSNLRGQFHHDMVEHPSDLSFSLLPDTPFATLRYPSPFTHDGHPSVYRPSPFHPHNFAQSSLPYYTGTNPGHPYQQQFPTIYPSDFYQFRHNMIPAQVLMNYPPQPVYHSYARSIASSQLPATSLIDDGAEPVLSQTGGNVDIDIRDDQILRSIKACFSRKGFIHTVIAFAVSGIVLNTLSTYMEYLLRLGGSGRQTVGIVGGSFQVLVMLSSIIVGKITDKTRAYYAVVIGLLLLGAFALAECNISLYDEHTNSLKWSLLCAAILIGPLQPVSTELAVDVSYPLCANTVLVIQQLVSNLFSALFIPLFQKLRDYGIQMDGNERPQYTFSFYLLIVIHGVATVFFATFNGKYMRLAHEQRSNNRDHKTSTSKSRSESNGYDDLCELSYDEEKTSLLKSSA
eukprot:CAMPEP_0176481464 /NCGR_PEP_ID=MMETSP0200_2-20121128/2838_1 /TAXON_ID=947934 /ORGANISM="Chaetoceros sp., Strain GSL56" /LENGTH=1442 /DNA_ID=CAMNT_0017877679 /DNA_START=223 /DNA_END=4551 /DNA_ORIENTATION=-